MQIIYLQPTNLLIMSHSSKGSPYTIHTPYSLTYCTPSPTPRLSTYIQQECDYCGVNTFHVPEKLAWQAYAAGVASHPSLDYYIEWFENQGPPWAPNYDISQPPHILLTTTSLPSFSSLICGLDGDVSKTPHQNHSPALLNSHPKPHQPVQNSDKENVLPVKTSSKCPSHTSATPKSTIGTKKFTPDNLIEIACTMIDKNPFMEPYKQCTVAWECVRTYLMGHGFCHNISTDVLRQKANALILYKKVFFPFFNCVTSTDMTQDPESQNPKVKAIASVLKSSKDGNDNRALIRISALLEQLEQDWDEAEKVEESKESEVKKVCSLSLNHCIQKFHALPQKQEENWSTGQEIHAASMKTMGSKASSSKK